MTLRSMLLVGLALAFAANFSPAATDALAAPHPSQVTAIPATGASGIQTGEYHTIINYSSVTGLPPAMAQHMMAHPSTVDTCVDSVDINAAVQDVISAGNMTCSEDHGSAVNGVISGSATCHDTDGNSGHLSFSGSYTATHVEVAGDLAAQTQIGPISEHVHFVSDRTGACTSN
jgi:hypothetical protein